eukprot:3936400-Rhodomonas_salina.2
MSLGIATRGRAVVPETGNGGRERARGERRERERERERAADAIGDLQTQLELFYAARTPHFTTRYTCIRAFQNWALAAITPLATQP